MTDRQLKSFCMSFRQGILGSKESDLMCAAVTYPLQGLLGLMGCETECVEVDLQHTNHVFLRLKDGRVLDATADQFGGPKVYLGAPMWFHTNKRSAPESHKESQQ